MRHIYCFVAVSVIVFAGTVCAEAQMVRQQGLLGSLGIETPAMRSARQQTAVAMQNRVAAQQLKAEADAAKDAVGDMLDTVRVEWKLSIDEIKTEAVESARILEEAKAMREKALAMTAEAEKAMAEAVVAKSEADKIAAEAQQAATKAAELQKAVEQMQAETAKQIEKYREDIEQLKQEREDFEKAKREHEEQKNKDQKEQQERFDKLNAKQEDSPQPVVVVEDDTSEPEDTLPQVTETGNEDSPENESSFTSLMFFE